VSEIIRTRTNQEQNISLDTPYYDVVRIKVRTTRPRGEGGKWLPYLTY
jgi:hypothetical protein